MKQTVEEAAREYANNEYGLENHESICETVAMSDFAIAVKCAFETGAEWQAKQSPWISVEERLPEEDGYYIVTDGTIVMIAYYFKGWSKFAQYKAYPHPFYEEGVITAYMPIPSFDQILEANKDVLQRMK